MLEVPSALRGMSEVSTQREVKLRKEQARTHLTAIAESPDTATAVTPHTCMRMQGHPLIKQRCTLQADLQSKRCYLALARSMLASEREKQHRWVCPGSSAPLSVTQLQELVDLGSLKVHSLSALTFLCY